jgi:predicted  nucleic acid-binding Zn-ribbon protein
MNDIEIQLVAEKFSHAVDLLKAKDFLNEHEISELRKQVDDMEKRLRAATTGVDQFKLYSGLTTGASSIVAIIALLRAIFGG